MCQDHYEFQNMRHCNLYTNEQYNDCQYQVINHKTISEWWI